MEKYSIEPENTRVCKIVDGTKPTFEILQASAETSTIINNLDGDDLEATIRVKRGDHAAEMSRICSAFMEAVKYTANDKQAAFCSNTSRVSALGAWKPTAGRSKRG